MQIVIKDKTYTTEKVPMLVRRKFLEVRAKEEKEIELNETISTEKQIEFEDELINILVIAFNKQFTAEDVLEDVEDDYFDKKLAEVVFGITENEGNTEGK